MPAAQRYRSVRDGAVADTGRAIAMAAIGAIGFAPIEYGLTLWRYPGAIRAVTALRLVALTATLAIWLWLLLALATAAVLVGARLIGAPFAPERGRGPSWCQVSPVLAGPGQIRPGVPALWAAVVTALASAAVIQRSAAWAIARFKEPELTAALIAAIAVVWIGLAAAIHRALARAVRAAATGLAPRCAAANPLGRWRAAGAALAALAGAGLAVIWLAVPQSRSVLPVRLAISALVTGLGMGLGARRHELRHTAPALRAARLAHLVRPRRRRRRALALAGSALVVMTTTLIWFGADVETRYVAITGSPALDQLIGVVRFANDLDRDGFGSLLGEGDCAPFNRAIHPGAIDIPDNGIDENCDGHDFSLRSATAAAPGTEPPVPSQFRKDWNILLLTIDALRYDHTTFGGYAASAAHRDTTPRLAELARRSVSFAFANAPSAGTMASIPAILTSKYFHSGIALDEHRPAGTPPGILPENTTLPEIMKRKGYATGVVGSHVWWNNWGLEQGVDDFDNSIARTDDPFRVAADRVTDHVLAWVSRQQGKRWFMWAHYIDPHGRYVAHPDVVDYGASEPDLYDAEIKWTDQEVGRLLRELARLPSYNQTIVIVTSDHGDSMAEHGVPLGTHGTALYGELQHVPLIFYIPDNQPRTLHGAVTNLDIVPTVAALCGIDVHDLSFEGRSLVPQLFYDGTDDHDRVVFAETNAPQKQRAAISEHWKLIYYFATNLYELFDLAADPGERTNLAPHAPPAMAQMKSALQAWMDRVMYARDPTFNQAFRQVADVALSAPPAPQVATAGQEIDGIAVLGASVADGQPLVRGRKVDVHVYFRVDRPTQVAYRFLLSAWPALSGSGAAASAAGASADGSGAAGSGGRATGATGINGTRDMVDPAPDQIYRTALRATADGAFATDHWRAGDYIRERFALVIPVDWPGDAIALGLVTADPTGIKRRATGVALPSDPFTAVLGTLPVSPAR